MTPTSVYRESNTDVCREKYMLDRLKATEELLDSAIALLYETADRKTHNRIRSIDNQFYELKGTQNV